MQNNPHFCRFSRLYWRGQWSSSALAQDEMQQKLGQFNSKSNAFVRVFMHFY